MSIQAYTTITGAKDLPTITYTPSQKAAGERRRRKRFTPAEPTLPPETDHQMQWLPEATG